MLLVLRKNSPALLLLYGNAQGKRFWPRRWTARFTPLSQAGKAGHLLFSGPWGEREGALLIFRAETEAQVEACVAEDPWTGNEVLVTERIARWEVRIGQLPGA